VAALRDRARAAASRRVADARIELASMRARLATLGPAATLSRGYAVVQHHGPGGGLAVLRSAARVAPGDALRIRLADGTVAATVAGEPPARHDVGHG
jgi:exodeoxyribonuclease VII large subunit